MARHSESGGSPKPSQSGREAAKSVQGEHRSKPDVKMPPAPKGKAR